MDRLTILNEIKRNIDILSNENNVAFKYIPLHQVPSPSVKRVREVMLLLRKVIFPGFFGSDSEAQSRSMTYFMGINLEAIYDLLTEQVLNGLRFENNQTCGGREQASEITVAFINCIPHLKYLLSTDIKAILDGDPAAKSVSEIIFCYPAVHAMLHHRVAHELLKLGVPVLPRIISELAHSDTGIDIHPGAAIGEYFSIDHGTGIVIGQTAIIGNHVKLYQGVTLGAKSFTLDVEGLPMDVPRHPVLKDNVTVYSNTSILGRITIGECSIIGGNVWLTHDVPPFSKILQTGTEDSKKINY